MTGELRVLLGGNPAGAPLYDVASSLPYDDMYLPRLRLAMRIGTEYRVTAIKGRHWDAFAERNRLDPAALRRRIDGLAARLPDAFRAAASVDEIKALHSELPERLVTQVEENVRRCRSALAAS